MPQYLRKEKRGALGWLATHQSPAKSIGNQLRNQGTKPCTPPNLSKGRSLNTSPEPTSESRWVETPEGAAQGNQSQVEHREKEYQSREDTSSAQSYPFARVIKDLVSKISP